MLHSEFIQAMVQEMYSFELKTIGELRLLSQEEMGEFYHAYCGGFCPLPTI